MDVSKITKFATIWLLIFFNYTFLISNFTSWLSLEFLNEFLERSRYSRELFIKYAKKPNSLIPPDTHTCAAHIRTSLAWVLFSIYVINFRAFLRRHKWLATHDQKFVIKYMCKEIWFSQILTERAGGTKKEHFIILPYHRLLRRHLEMISSRK